jgi:undecaprenyl-diphosphatase
MNFFQLYEIKLFYWINSFAFQKDWIDALIIFRAAYLGYAVVAAILLFFIATYIRQYGYLRARNTEMVLFSLGAGVIARFFVKPVIGIFYQRVRPYDAIPFVKKLIEDSTNSFPSGHALFFFACATGVSFYYPRVSILFFLAAFTIGLARIEAGAHWPSDVVAGALLGVLTAYILRVLWKKTV